MEYSAADFFDNSISLKEKARQDRQVENTKLQEVPHAQQRSTDPLDLVGVEALFLLFVFLEKVRAPKA